MDKESVTHKVFNGQKKGKKKKLEIETVEEEQEEEKHELVNKLIKKSD